MQLFPDTRGSTSQPEYDDWDFDLPCCEEPVEEQDGRPQSRVDREKQEKETKMIVEHFYLPVTLPEGVVLSDECHHDEDVRIELAVNSSSLK